MIRYTLGCDHRHTFESWFPSIEAYDDQTRRGLVACPVCGSQSVAKTLMAPAIARTDRGPRPSPAVEPRAVAPATTPEQPVALIAEPERRLRALLKAVRENVLQTADDVGARFPSEARAMHYGEVDSRAIYGQASPDEAQALIEEGIAVLPLPPSPDERN